MPITPSPSLLRLTNEEHDLLIGCHHAMERTTRHCYSSPVTGILLDEMTRFHERLVAELQIHAMDVSMEVLLADHDIINLRLQGLDVRYVRGDNIVTDMNELIADWYQLHALFHAMLEHANANTETARIQR